MKIVMKAPHKSIPQGAEFDLPNFAIITGINGTGKSHLLEAMSNPGITDIIDNNNKIGSRIYIGINELAPQMAEQCDSRVINEAVQKIWSEIKSFSHTIGHHENAGSRPEEIIKTLRSLYEKGSKAVDFLERHAEYLPTPLSSITHDDIYKHFEIESSQNIFTTQCAMVFKTYQAKVGKNLYNEFLASKRPDAKINVQTDEEFIILNGPPPWDVINEILAEAGLPYKFNKPDLIDADAPFFLRLIDTESNKEISVNQLSSGEKVIMSLALAIYNSQKTDDRCQLLLLDEPDAPLHPQFSKLLIDTIRNSIVSTTGVRVVMTTHSPTTIAMAPDNSIFELDRTTKSIKMVSNAHAVSALTQGIEHLRVNYENRRQIFVEGQNDVKYYTQLFNTLKKDHDFPYNPIFIEPHSGNANCTDVTSIVGKLRESGSDLAWGIIDYDKTNTTSDSIIVLGHGKRYAIDNYILDPLYICLALIRDRKKSFSDFGLSGDKTTYIDVGKLSNNECQTMVDNLLERIGYTSTTDTSESICENGYTIHYPKDFLLCQGHSYERTLLDRIPELNSLARHKGEAALKLAILGVIDEYRQFLPTDIATTFMAIR